MVYGVSAVRGILNGHLQLHLTTMESSGRSFDDVLKDAQAAWLCRSQSGT